MNGAEILCETLLAHEINVCFANPGTSEMHFVAALDRKPQMRCVLGLFEGIVTGAADGYARMAEKPAATLLHLGPGLANGLANLHNARRANTPMVNIVGDHATAHLPLDTAHVTDIDSLARPMSHYVRRVRGASDVSSATAEAIAATRRHAGGVSTLILPADAAWGDAPAVIRRAPPAVPTVVTEQALLDAAEALRNGKRSALLLGRNALRAAAMHTASRIAAHVGARLLVPIANARMERGQGRALAERIPYNVNLALESLADLEQIILVDALEPVAFFAYPDKPGRLAPRDCRILSLTDASDDVTQALEMLSDLVGASNARPLLASNTDRTALPAANGPLSPDSVIRSIAALLPDNAILCDESVSSGRTAFPLMAGSAPHDYLQVTGGSIGGGIPLSCGAAIACPDRKVILMQADGSGMYTLQGLWTQARERLDVLTIIFSNRSYAILYNELKQVGAGTAGVNARRMLDLDDPSIDWVRLSQAVGVEAARAEDLSTFIDLLRRGIKHRGPFLIEAALG